LMRWMYQASPVSFMAVKLAVVQLGLLVLCLQRATARRSWPSRRGPRSTRAIVCYPSPSSPRCPPDHCGFTNRLLTSSSRSCSRAGAGGPERVHVAVGRGQAMAMSRARSTPWRRAGCAAAWTARATRGSVCAAFIALGPTRKGAARRDRGLLVQRRRRTRLHGGRAARRPRLRVRRPRPAGGGPRRPGP
jgi:hypothetical protein